MPQKTIPELTAVTEITEAALIPVDSGTETFKMTRKNLSKSLKLPTQVVTNAFAGTVEQTHYYADTSTGAISLALPNPASTEQGFTFDVKDIDGLAGSNTITITRHGSESINGVAGNFLCNYNFGFWSFTFDGSNWWVTEGLPASNTQPGLVLPGIAQEFSGAKTFRTAAPGTESTIKIQVDNNNEASLEIDNSVTARRVKIGILSGTGGDFCISGKDKALGYATSFLYYDVFERLTFTSTSVLNPTTCRQENASTTSPALHIQKRLNSTATSNDFITFGINNSDSGNSGRIAANGANTAAFQTTSDERLKTNIKTFVGGLKKILGLRTVNFEWKERPGERAIGWIAQEVEKVIPDAVCPPDPKSEVPYKTFYSMTRENFIPYMVSAIQELNEKIETLENEIKKLKKER